MRNVNKGDPYNPPYPPPEPPPPPPPPMPSPKEEINMSIDEAVRALREAANNPNDKAALRKAMGMVEAIKIGAETLGIDSPVIETAGRYGMLLLDAVNGRSSLSSQQLDDMADTLGGMKFPDNP